MQDAPDRNGQRSGDAHRIILLQTRDCFADFIAKDAVDRSAIITKPRQIALQRADVSWLRNQLTPGLEVISRPPSISRRKIGFVNGRSALMQQPPIVARCQRVGVVKKRPIKKYVVNVGPDDNSAECNDEQSCDGMFHNLFALNWCSPKWQIRRRQLLFFGGFRRTIGTITLVELGPEVSVVLNLFA